jgi:hypothetical protein
MPATSARSCYYAPTDGFDDTWARGEPETRREVPGTAPLIGASPVKAHDSSELGFARDIIELCAQSKHCATCVDEDQMRT